MPWIPQVIYLVLRRINTCIFHLKSYILMKPASHWLASSLPDHFVKIELYSFLSILTTCLLHTPRHLVGNRPCCSEIIHAIQGTPPPCYPLSWQRLSLWTTPFPNSSPQLRSFAHSGFTFSLFDSFFSSPSGLSVLLLNIEHRG